MTAGGDPTSRVESYDPDAGSWSRGPDLPSFGFGVAATSVEGSIYASGRDGRVYRVREDRSEWDPVATLLVPRIFHRMLSVGPGEVFVVCGATREEHLRGIESLELPASNGKTSVER